MLHKGFLKGRNVKRTFRDRNKSMASRILLYLGIVIVIGSLIFMITNINNANSEISLFIPLLLVGFFFVVISFLIKWFYKRKTR